MIRTVFTLSLALGLSAARAAEPGPLQGELTKVELLSGSKNQPALAVLAGGALYYSEAKYLDSTKAEDCPAADLYRYDLKERKETRLAEIACVVNVLTEGAHVFVTHRVDSELSVAKVGADLKLVTPADDYLSKIKARVAFKRSTLKLARGVEQKLVGFVIREKELNAVIRAGDHLFFDAVPFDVASKQTILAISVQGALEPGISLNATGLYAFTKGDQGWLRAVETTHDGKSTVLGHQRPLPKRWTEVGSLDWAARNPKFLTCTPEGFLVADRTSEAFTEAPAVSLYSSADKKFYRLKVAEQDVGGLSYAADGVLISKPMAGSIVWYGKKNPFQVEEKEKK